MKYKSKRPPGTVYIGNRRVLSGTDKHAFFGLLWKLKLTDDEDRLLGELNRRDHVAVVVIRPTEHAANTLRAIGWDGAANVFQLSDERRAELAKLAAEQADPCGAAWFRGETGAGRKLVFFEGAKYLVNSDHRELSFEPKRGG